MYLCQQLKWTGIKLLWKFSPDLTNARQCIIAFVEQHINLSDRHTPTACYDDDLKCDAPA